jgi:hypothetical protein
LLGRLYLLHLGDSFNDLRHSTFDGTWRPNVRVERQSAKAAPALAAYRDQVEMVHLGNTSNDLWHSSYRRPGGRVIIITRARRFPTTTW